MSKPIIKCIKEYMKTCPYLEDLAKIKVDFLDPGDKSKDKECWSIEKVEAPIVLKGNVLGTRTQRQCVFIIASHTFHNPLVDTPNIDNLQLYDNIAEWFLQKSRRKELPILNEGEIPIKIEAIDSGFLYGLNEKSTLARYQMRCRLLYEKEEERIWR